MNILEDFHESSMEVFRNKDGNDHKTTLAKVVDLNFFVGRNMQTKNLNLKTKNLKLRSWSCEAEARNLKPGS